MANRKYWTEERIEEFKKEYANGDLSLLAEKHGVKPVTVYALAKQFGISRNTEDAWTDAEIDTLKKLFPKTDNSEVAEKIGKTVSAIRNKAVKLKLKKTNNYWKVGQEKYLLDNYGKIPLDDIMKYLKKTKWAVINKYRELTGKRKTGEGRTIKSEMRYQKDK